MPNNIHTDPQHTIGIALEPIEFLGLTDEFIDYAKKYIGKYFIGEYANRLGSPFINKRFFCIHMEYPLTLPEKSNVMSITFSEKQYAPGHKYRHELVKRILQSDLPIDIYGRGCGLLNVDDHRIKGIFKDDIVVHGSYKYHIAIENHKRKWYYTEKIINPLLCGTVPIYWGCTNIDEIFPDIPIISLTGDVDTDMQTIRSLCEANIAIDFDRAKVKYEYLSLDRIIQSY